MEKNGYFCISRGIVKNWLYPTNQKRKLSEFEAWLEMIRQAKFVCVKKEIQGNLVLIPRGCFDTTVCELSRIFGWDRRTVEKFLKLLEQDKMISRFKINPKSLKSCSIIKIQNYNLYQSEIYEQCKSEYKKSCNLNCKRKENVLENDFYMGLSR